MTDRYDEWRDFYLERVGSWMSREELRAECGKLTTTEAPSPEVLLIHAMHLLERYEQRNEAMRTEVDEWKRVSAAKGEAEARAERLEEALKKVAQSLEWYAHGRCRGFDDAAPLPPNEAVELAERTLASVRA